MHIHIKNPENTRSSQIPGHERGMGEDVACALAIQVRKPKRREVCHVGRGSGSSRLRAQASLSTSLSALTPPRRPPGNPTPKQGHSNRCLDLQSEEGLFPGVEALTANSCQC